MFRDRANRPSASTCLRFIGQRSFRAICSATANRQKWWTSRNCHSELTSKVPRRGLCLGGDPSDDADPLKSPKRREAGQRSLELFLAHFCAALSGGRRVTVEDVQSLLARYPTLLVLDGLDEVADPELRAIIVEQINTAATRMGARENLRRFQILVTARPNASGLAEPDKDIFQTLRLEPLAPALQRLFVNKWCDVNDIQGRAWRDLRRTFLDRTALDHVAQLADNPMQLTILLFLINRKGEARSIFLVPRSIPTTWLPFWTGKSSES